MLFIYISPPIYSLKRQDLQTRSIDSTETAGKRIEAVINRRNITVIVAVMHLYICSPS